MIYDFDAVSPEELGVKEGDTVTVVDAGVGQGWVRARARDGREGVVPEAYLERADAGDAGVRRESATPSANSYGEDWDSDEEEHRSVRVERERRRTGSECITTRVEIILLMTGDRTGDPFIERL